MAKEEYVIEYHLEAGRPVYRTFTDEEQFDKAMKDFKQTKTGVIQWSEPSAGDMETEGVSVEGDVTFMLRRETVKVVRSYKQIIEEAANDE